jgi:hypothetical protein
VGYVTPSSCARKDTAIHMPPLAAAISVQGVGKGGSTAAAFGWITGAERVFYWGDMDADGFEILDGFRAAGVPATSILMDMAAYTAGKRYGTNDDPKGQPLKPGKPKALPHLTAAEREPYDCLTSPDWHRYRRIEQERIPITCLGRVDRQVARSHLNAAFKRRRFRGRDSG